MEIEQQKKLSYKLLNLKCRVAVCNSLLGKGSALSADSMLHVNQQLDGVLKAECSIY